MDIKFSPSPFKLNLKRYTILTQNQPYYGKLPNASPIAGVKKGQALYTRGKERKYEILDIATITRKGYSDFLDFYSDFEHYMILGDLGSSQLPSGISVEFQGMGFYFNYNLNS